LAILIEEALKNIYSSLKPVKSELIPIESALNRVIARNVIAKYPLPNFDNSAMDGYGVTILDAGERVNIIKTIFAGDSVDDEFQLNKGEAIKIMTGAKVPSNCTSIIPFEDIESDGKSIQLPNSIKQGNHIRKMGEDISNGTLIIEKGERLNSYKVGLLASQGVAYIEVFKKPKVAVFATGAELKMHYEQIEPHQIYNTNSPMLLQRSIELGADVTFIKTTEDSKEAIKEAIKECLDSDLIITSGGVSVGEADFTKESFLELGFNSIFEGVEIKPGKPITFGKIFKTAVINLPGNPSAALINFEIFGKSALLTLSGDLNRYIKTQNIPLSEDLKVKKGKYTVVLGSYNGEDFRPLNKRSPGMVKPLADSNGFIVLHKDRDELKSGSIVKFIPTDYLWTTDIREEIYS